MTRINQDRVTGTLDAAEVGDTYQFRKGGRDSGAMLQIRTYTTDLSGTYHLEVADPDGSTFTQLCETDGTEIAWTDQGVVFVLTPAASCDVRLNMTARVSGSLTYTISSD